MDSGSLCSKRIVEVRVLRGSDLGWMEVVVREYDARNWDYKRLKKRWTVVA